MPTLTFDQALTEVSAIAHARLPVELHGRLEMGTALVSHGAVWLEDDGLHASVKSRSQEGRWHSVNGSCDCEDAHFQAPQHLCAHRLAVGLARRAAERLREAPVAVEAVLVPPPVTPVGIDEHYIVLLHGKRYARYAGLLSLAHARGLVRLEACFVSVTAELALATATATFADGRVFTEAADSTPANCGVQVRAHYPRMALVRAKARCLRDALNIGDLCTIEEMGEQEGTP